MKDLATLGCKIHGLVEYVSMCFFLLEALMDPFKGFEGACGSI